MKTLPSLLMTALVVATAYSADSIRFGEVLRDVQVCERFEGELDCFVIQRNSGRLSARVTLPGLGAKLLDESTTVGVRLGNFEFEADAGSSTSSSANRVRFIIGETDDESGRFIRHGTITFSRARDVARVVASFTRLPASIVADSGSWEEDGRGTLDFAVRVDELAASRTVYFKTRITQRRPRNPEDEPLVTIGVAGTADFTRPTVRVSTPRNRTKTTEGAIAFQGTARDNIGVAEVQYRVGDGDWFTADGTTAWTVNVPLEPGTNVVQVRSLDWEGQESKPASRTIIRQTP